jgi:hypothetical protein
MQMFWARADRGERDAHPLDEHTAERLVSGDLFADDAPPGYAGVVRAADALRAPATAAELAGEACAVQAITAAMAVPEQIQADSTIARRSRRGARIAAGALVGSAVLFGGLAGANALPGAAQGVAHDVLGSLGVNVPDVDDHAGDHPATRGRSESAPPTQDSTGETPSDDGQTPETSTESAGSGHGDAISDLARTTTEEGVDKGAVISTEASGGQSRAGEHGAPDGVGQGEPPSQAPDGPPANLPGGPQTGEEHGAPGADHAADGLANRP